MTTETLFRSISLPFAPLPSGAEISGIAIDSRKAKAGDLFICLRGSATDGHLFARDAYEKGCRLFLCEEKPDVGSDASCLIVPDTRALLPSLSAAFFGHPEREIRLVGITGTKGKTTTSLLLAHLLEDGGIPTGYIGTNGIRYAGKTFSSANTTPESIELYRILREMADAGVRA
ncbi:MAG: hypothetical protein II797_05135, partial [Clostridia bacterium]|nr:hypothetical protein [Clostridia bacterium]